jgi:4-oxalocrotonate tautomerase
MPHVIVRLWPGESEQQTTERIVKAVTSARHYGDDSVSVPFEEIEPKDWTEKVYKPAIAGRWGTLYKKPGYNPLR